MLFGVVLGLSGFFQTRESGKAITDDFVFRFEELNLVSFPKYILSRLFFLQGCFTASPAASSSWPRRWLGCRILSVIFFVINY